MNSFSFNRFGKTLRWVMAVNFRTLLMWTIGSVVAVFVGELMTAEIGKYSAYGTFLLMRWLTYTELWDLHSLYWFHSSWPVPSCRV